MKVIEKMQELKKQGIVVVWIRDNITKYEYIYNTKGYSSIENPEYVEMNKDIFESEVEECQILESINEARITYRKRKQK